MNTQAEIKHAFAPVGQLDQVKLQKVLRLQEAAKMFAEELYDLCPPSADRTHALRLALNAKFWGVQAITHEQKEKVSGNKNQVQEKVAQEQA